MSVLATTETANTTVKICSAATAVTAMMDLN